MKIAAIKRNSFVDCPKGVCTTIFTQGCNLACPFCYNKELWSIYTPEKISYDEALRIAVADKDISKWVCLTGGEPLLQKHLGEFINDLHKENLNVKLDTNGQLPFALEALLKECPDSIKYAAVDIKFNEFQVKLLKTLKLLQKHNIETELRITLDGNANCVSDGQWELLLTIITKLYPKFPIYGQHYKAQGKAIGRRITEEETTHLLKIAKDIGANFTIREQE